MTFDRNLVEELKCKADADFHGGTGHRGKKPVVKPRASTEAIPVHRKGQTRNNHEIQTFRTHVADRFADSGWCGTKFRELGDLAKQKGLGVAARIGNLMMLEQAEFPQKVQVRFKFFRREQGDAVFAGEKSSEFLANLDGSFASFASVSIRAGARASFHAREIYQKNVIWDLP